MLENDNLSYRSKQRITCCAGMFAFLGHILGEVLVHQGGNDLLDVVERIREMSKSLRAHYVIEIYDEFKRNDYLP